uniref:Immunoglobulin V-set domain-containing protein n=1 Tax=Nothobranchius furzeri TaxID=105023 RepID=A0A8C6MBB9_NOTFU
MLAGLLGKSERLFALIILRWRITAEVTNAFECHILSLCRSSLYRNSIKYLCKGKQWISCIKVAETTQNRWQRFSISDDTQLNIFTVTINNLTSEDKHFWCAVDRFIQDIKQHFTLSVTSGKSFRGGSRTTLKGDQGGATCSVQPGAHRRRTRHAASSF